MANNEIKITLDGIIPLELYSQALSHFTSLVFKLSDEVSGGENIDWTVIELKSGSAIGTIRGYAENIDRVERVVTAVGITMQSASSGQTIPYSPDIEEDIQGLTSILNGKITAIHIEAGDVITPIYNPIDFEVIHETTKRELGIVTGILHSVTDKPRIAITIYDPLFDKAIKCRLSGDFDNVVREAWRKKVSVTGMIKRDPVTGRAIDVTNVNRIELATENPNGFLNARGKILWAEGDEKAEETLRRIRDDIEE